MRNPPRWKLHHVHTDSFLPQNPHRHCFCQGPHRPVFPPQSPHRHIFSSKTTQTPILLPSPRGQPVFGQRNADTRLPPKSMRTLIRTSTQTLIPPVPADTFSASPQTPVLLQVHTDTCFLPKSTRTPFFQPKAMRTPECPQRPRGHVLHVHADTILQSTRTRFPQVHADTCSSSPRGHVVLKYTGTLVPQVHADTSSPQGHSGTSPRGHVLRKSTRTWMPKPSTRPMGKAMRYKESRGESTPFLNSRKQGCPDAFHIKLLRGHITRPSPRRKSMRVSRIRSTVVSR